MQKSNDSWPGPDEDAVIDTMLADRDSPHWNKCYEMVEKLVQKWASDLSLDDKPEVIQNVMMRVAIYLPSFKRESKLSTWLIKIVRSCRADDFRKLQATSRIKTIPLDVSPHDDDDIENNDPPALLTAEEEFLQREELQEIYEALLKHLAGNGKHRKHRKQERNKRILDLYLDGFNHQEIAKELGIPAPVVGYVIRSIQDFAKEFRDPPLPKTLR